MPKAFIALLLLSIASAASVDPDAALARLQKGNARVVSGRAAHPHQSKTDRAAVANGQKPFAVIVSCSDSRVPPELVFDQGLGDLFVVRVAGEVVDAPALGCIEYAIAHLGSGLIVVLGHERCGAVKAAIDAVAGMNGDKLDLAIRANVARVAGQIRAATAENGVKVTGMDYDLDTGKVESVPRHITAPTPL